ncbi:MAG: hypothetical protein PHI96_01550 [Desulfovibrio sp.]|nr:hypothetical protein [Desulfovibrio sp.]
MLRNWLTFFRVILPVFTILALLASVLPAVSAQSPTGAPPAKTNSTVTPSKANVQASPANNAPASAKSDTAPKAVAGAEADAAQDKDQDKDQDDMSPAQAESLFSTEYQTCMDNAAGVTTEMQDCINTEQGRLEKIIAFRQVALDPVLGEERSKALHEAVTAWEALRKHGSTAMYDPDGGTLSPLIAALWHLEQTARMAQWLNSLAENAE